MLKIVYLFFMLSGLIGVQSAMASARSTLPLTVDAELPKKDWAVEAGVFTNHIDLGFEIQSTGATSFEVSIEMEDYDPDTFEAEMAFEAELSRLLGFMVIHRYEDSEVFHLLGLALHLPGDLEVEVFALAEGKGFELVIAKRFQLSKRTTADLWAEYTGEGPNWEYEWGLDFEYQIKTRWYIGSFYEKTEDSQSLGVGFRFRE